MLTECGWLAFPFAPLPDDLLDARVLHDLGIAGDDLDAFIMELDARCRIPPFAGDLGPFTPGETSGDAYCVAMARGRLARRISRSGDFFRRRIRARPFTPRKRDTLRYPDGHSAD